MLFALLGTGCEEVTRVESADAAVVACRWKDGRIGTMRALRPQSDYGVVVFRKTREGAHVAGHCHPLDSRPSSTGNC